MSSRHSMCSKPALTSSLIPESPCQCYTCRRCSACRFAKKQLYFAHLRLTGRQEEEKKFMCTLQKFTDSLHRPKSFWFLTRWVEIQNSLYFSVTSGQKHRAFELPQNCPDNLASKGVKLHLIKAWTELNNLGKMGLIGGSYFIEQPVFANCKFNLW